MSISIPQECEVTGLNYETDIIYVGLTSKLGNEIMIIISVLGIFINIFFSASYYKRIFKANGGVSSIEKTLCTAATVETLISICWLLNNALIQNSKNLIDRCSFCKPIAHIEIFLYLFDWMILSSSLYQIRKIIYNPKKLLESGRTFIICIGGSFFISAFSFLFSIISNIGGVSPMLTCFINIQHLHEKPIRQAFFWLFFSLPLICFIFGGIQICKITSSTQYKNDKQLFKEYSYFIITYIFFSVLLIICYIVNYFKKDLKSDNFYNVYIMITTFLSCLTPLIVGIFRVYRTGFIQSLFSKKPQIKERLLDEDENNNEGGRMYNIEKKLLEKLIIKYFVAVSYALGKSKYDEETEEGQEGKIIEEGETFEPNERSEYIITKANILKDLDLSINEDIKVLEEPYIDIVVTEYNSSIFKKIRKLEDLSEDKIISMFQPKKGTTQLMKKIKETIYINSTNKLLMLKQIKKESFLFYQRNILKDLYEHFVNHKNSLICRVFGLFKINIDHTEDVYMALMYNINESLETIENINIMSQKNEVRQMKINESQLKRSIVIDSKRNKNELRKFTIDIQKSNFDESIMVGGSQTNTNNKLFNINLTDYENEKLINIINQDTAFLRNKNVYGFSFLIFERNIENKDRISLFKDDGEEKGERISHGNVSKFSSNIRKYIFNSNLSNIVYSICILDFFNKNK